MIRILLTRLLWMPLIALFLATLGYIILSGLDNEERSTISASVLPSATT